MVLPAWLETRSHYAVWIHIMNANKSSVTVWKMLSSRTIFVVRELYLNVTTGQSMSNIHDYIVFIPGISKTRIADSILSAQLFQLLK